MNAASMLSRRGARSALLESLLFSTVVASFALSLPTYRRMATQHWLFRPTELESLLALVLVVSVLPISIVWALDLGIARLVPSFRVLRGWRVVLFSAMILFALLEGLISGNHWQDWPRAPIGPGHPPSPLAAAYFASIPLVTALCLRFYGRILPFIGNLGPVAVAFTLFGLSQIYAGGWPWHGEPRAPGFANVPPLQGPVLLLIFDELSYDVILRDRSIDAERFPNLAALAHDGVEFTNATTNFSSTMYAFPLLLTGEVVPPEFDRELLHSKSLLSRLATSHRVQVFEEVLADCLAAGPVCHTSQQRRPVARALMDGIWEPFINHASIGHVGLVRYFPVLVQDYLPDLVAALRAPEAVETIFFFHSYPPHAPYVFDADGNPTQVEHYVGVNGLPFERVYPNYVNTVRYADRRLGTVLEALREGGLYDRATIVVTADHGLRPYGVFAEDRPITAWFHLIPRVPLIVKAPGLAPSTSAVDYQHLDFYPTVLDLLRLPPQPDLPGVSAFAAQRPRRTKFIYYGSPDASHHYEFDSTTGNWWRPVAPPETS